MADSTLPIGGAIDLTPPGEVYGTWLEQVHEWVVTVDHKKIGLMYIAYALIFLLVGGWKRYCYVFSWPCRTTIFFPLRFLTESSPCTARPWSS